MTRKFSIIFLNVVLTTSILLAQQKKTDTLYFDHNKYDLSETAKIKLTLLYENNKGKEILDIDLAGYTDSDGSDKYNFILSQKRTKAVADFFISKGIKSDLIKINCYGESKSINFNEKDRRVEIVIKTKEFIDTSKQQVVEKKEIVVGDIFEKLKKEPQKFKCLANENTIIKGKEGTIIVIPAFSLTKKNGEFVMGEVDITLEEFYKKSEMISANLNTMSNNEILETAGMINISASQHGEQLILGKGNEITIQMVAKDTLKGMQTFVAENSGNEMNWNLPQSEKIDTAITPLKQKRKMMMGQGFLIHRFVKIFFRKSVNSNQQPPGISNKAIEEQLSKADNIIIKSNKLGWINCDRFPNIKNKTNVTITVDTAYWPAVRLVFKNINSIMPGYYTDKKEVQFINVPIGYKVTLIGISLANDEPYYSSKEIVITKDLKINLELFKTTLTKLREELKKLD
jgi:hypothetical protein